MAGVPILLAVAAILASTGHARTGVVNVLDKTGPTRSEAVGGAVTAIGRDATLISVNPASAAQITRPSLTLAGQSGLFGEVLGQMVLAAPLTEGVMAFSAAYYDTGTTKVFTADDKLINLHMQSDFMGSLTYSRALAPALAIGGTVKGLNSRLMEETSSAAFAVDLGAQYRITQVIKAGVAVQNVGSQLRYLDDKFSLPSAARGGVALGFPSADGRDLMIMTGDAEYALTGQGVTWSAGAEYQWHGMASLRAGIRMTPVKELAALAFGAGLVFQQYRIDYSVRMGGEFDSPQTLSLTMDFPRAAAPAPALLVPAMAPGPAIPAMPVAPSAQAIPAIGPASSSSATTGAEPLTAPVILPGAPAPLPMAPSNGVQKGKSNGAADDLNRELDELLKQTGGK